MDGAVSTIRSRQGEDKMRVRETGRKEEEETEKDENPQNKKNE